MTSAMMAKGMSVACVPLGFLQLVLHSSNTALRYSLPSSGCVEVQLKTSSVVRVR